MPKEFVTLKVELCRTEGGKPTCVGCKYKDTEMTYGSPGGDYDYPVCTLLNNESLSWPKAGLVTPSKRCPLWTLWKGKKK
jgi:hypothetical protein